jgi:hypothetical protein
VHFFDADSLTGKDLAEIDLFRPMQMRPQRVTTMVLSQKMQYLAPAVNAAIRAVLR